MKTEHEKLKDICDKIGYKIQSKDIIRSKITGKSLDVNIRYNIREIIFTPEFKAKFEEYYYGKKEGELYTFDEVLNYLDNPVEYLYNLLELGKQKH